MNTSFTPVRRKRSPFVIVAIAAVAVIIAIVVLAVFWPKSTAQTVEYPMYYNFAGNYTFTVPAEYSVDEQSIPGIQLVYSGTFAVKTLADLYDAGGISVRAFTESGSSNFKEFVDKTYVANLKKELETEDMQVKFSSDDGQDVAQITAKKDGAAFRFFYIKNGKHPVAVTAKEETEVLKKIAPTLADVESTSQKDEVEPIKKAIQTVGEQARDRKIDELYGAASPELQSNSTKEQVAAAIEASRDYLQGNVTVAGVSLDDAQTFTAAMRFVKLDDAEGKNPAYGSLTMKKIDGQWKLVALGVPSQQPAEE